MRKRTTALRLTREACCIATRSMASRRDFGGSIGGMSALRDARKQVLRAFAQDELRPLQVPHVGVKKTLLQRATDCRREPGPEVADA